MGLYQNCAQGHFFVIFIGTCPCSWYNLHAYFFQSHNMFASDVLNSNQFKSYLSVFNMFMNFMKCQMMWKFESIALPLYVAYHLYPIRLQWSLLVMIMAGIVPLFYSHIHRYFMLILEQLHPQSGHMLTPHSLWHFKVCQRLWVESHVTVPIDKVSFFQFCQLFFIDSVFSCHWSSHLNSESGLRR